MGHVSANSPKSGRPTAGQPHKVDVLKPPLMGGRRSNGRTVTKEAAVTDHPTASAKPSAAHLQRAREEHEAASRDQAARDEQAQEDESREAMSQMTDARDRAEAMGDVVEEGTRESGTGTRSADD